MARKVKSPGGHPPVYTGKGTHGTGLGYHGKPRGATTPAKGMGYHGHPPAKVAKMVHPIAKPPAHRAGTKRHPGR